MRTGGVDGRTPRWCQQPVQLTRWQSKLRGPPCWRWSTASHIFAHPGGASAWCSVAFRFETSESRTGYLLRQARNADHKCLLGLFAGT